MYAIDLRIVKESPYTTNKGVSVQFFGVLVIASFVTILGSFLWPRFTVRPAPPVLSVVRSAAMTTPIGKTVATVLGVSDPAHTQVITVDGIVSGVVKGATTAVGNRIQYVITTQAARELTKQFEDLPLGQQEQIRQLICTPSQTQSTP
jgi:hypothetical protein